MDLIFPISQYVYSPTRNCRGDNNFFFLGGGVDKFYKILVGGGYNKWGGGGGKIGGKSRNLAKNCMKLKELWLILENPKVFS